MHQLGLSFPEAFRLLWRHRKVLLVERVLIYDLSARSLWEREGSWMAARVSAKGLSAPGTTPLAEYGCRLTYPR